MTVLVCLCSLFPATGHAQTPGVRAQVRQAIVPGVTNRPLETALAMIERAGLARGRVVDRPSSRQPGLVLDQSLKAGTRVPRDTPLHLGVAQVELVTVPDVTKLPAGDAFVRIENAGLTRGNVTNREVTGPPDLILEQSLSPGARVPRGTALHLTVSQAQPATPPDATNPPIDGPPAQPATSPDVNPPVLQPPAQPPTPAAVPPTRAALLVPDVVGHSVAEATALIGVAALTVGTVTERSFLLPPYFEPAGTVFQQQPAAGTPLAAAVPVDLIVLPRVPAWAIIIPSAMLGAAIVLLLRRRPLLSPLKTPPPQVPLPTVVTRAYRDPGDQRIPSVMNPVGPEIRVRHAADPGTQSIREILPSPH